MGDMWVAKMIKKAGKSSILSVDWSPNNMFIIAGGSDFKCRVFSAYIKGVDTDCKVDDYGGAIAAKQASSFGSTLCEFDASKGWIESCRFSQSGMRFAFDGNEWKEKGAIDTGAKSKAAPKKQKSAFGNAFSKFNNASKLGGRDKGSDAALPYRHQNMINDVDVYGETKFTTSSVDGRVLFWDLKKKY